MGDLEPTSHDSFNRIPYLTENKSTYRKDLQKVLIDNNDSKDKIYDDIKNFNTFIQDYVEYRGKIVPSEDLNELDKQVIMALNSNNALVTQTMQDKNETYKEIYNLVKSAERDNQYKKVITDIISGRNLDGDEDIDTGGEMDEINQTYDKLKIDLANKKRHLQISLYTENKLKKQNSVLRNVFIFLMVLMIISIIKKMGMLSDNLYASVVGLVFALMCIYIMYEAYDIYLRDSVEFENYRFIGGPRGSSGKDIKKEGIDLPFHLQNDLPGYCDLEKKVKDSLTLNKVE